MTLAAVGHTITSLVTDMFPGPRGPAEPPPIRIAEFSRQHPELFAHGPRAEEGAGVEAGGEITLALHHWQAHDGLRARHEGAAGAQGVLVIKRDFARRDRGVHGASAPSVAGAISMPACADLC